MIRRPKPHHMGRLEHCARCGHNHRGLVFKGFKHPVTGMVEHTHWATCPRTGDPILMRIIPATFSSRRQLA